MVNLSNHVLSKDQESLLKKGLNFAPTPEKVPTEEMIVVTEEACSMVPPPQAEALPSEVVSAIRAHKITESNITISERKALKELQKEIDILVLPADKGRATVVLNKSEYETKMPTMLSDHNTYSVLSSDPTERYKKQLNKKLEKLRKDEKITDSQLQYLKPSSDYIPRIYGTPKIHKQGAQLRPIVDYTGSITYAVARSVADILYPLMGKTEHHVKNSKDLVKELKEKTLGQDEILVSYDVVSLFTKVPIPEAIEVERSRLEQDDKLSERTNLTVDDIIDLLEFLCSTTYFSFNDKIYEQKFGTAMGSPVSPILANLFMEHLETKAIATCPNECKPSFWKRYVDDALCAIKNGKREQLTQHLNTVDSTGSIQFTYEDEVDRSLPYLDVNITRHENGKLSTKVYRKATHTDQYLQFTSAHPLHQKLGVIRSLLDRKDSVITSEVEKTKEDKHLETVLQANGYQKWTINMAKRQKSESEKRKDGKKNKSKDNNQNNTRRKLVVLPYVQGLSERIAKIYKNHDITTCMKPNSTLRQALVHPKDKVQKLRNSGVVYEIPCMNCKATYIGETKRNLSIRISEHKRDVTQQEKKQFTRSARKESSSEINKSAVTDHVNTRNHVIDWEQVKIVSKETNVFRRRVRESIAIRKRQETMNRDAGAHQLAHVYDWLLRSTDTRSTVTPVVTKASGRS